MKKITKTSPFKLHPTNKKQYFNKTEAQHLIYSKLKDLLPVTSNSNLQWATLFTLYFRFKKWQNNHIDFISRDDELMVILMEYF